MGKRLNTTVHLTDPETGENRILGPNDKLSQADVKALKEGWGRNADQFFEDDDEEDGSLVDAEGALAQGTAPADRVPVDSSDQAKSAQEVNEKARTDAAPEGVEDSEGSKPRGRRNVGG